MSNLHSGNVTPAPLPFNTDSFSVYVVVHILVRLYRKPMTDTSSVNGLASSASKLDQSDHESIRIYAPTYTKITL